MIAVGTIVLAVAVVAIVPDRATIALGTLVVLLTLAGFHSQKDD